MFLRHARRLLHTGVRLLRKRGSQLLQQERFQFEHHLKLLEEALVAKNKPEAKAAALKVKEFIKAYFPKTLWDYLRELSYALAFAIIVAFVIRQFWFELYQVPTGSMRPTVEELDRLVVSKTTFGLRLPFYNKMLFSSEDAIQRAASVILTTKGLDIPDSDMRYFHLIPGKKRFIKRCMGKPGDTLYFYGGYLYGIDRNGEAIKELADPTFLNRYGLNKIDHVPYATFSGKVEVEPASPFSPYHGARFKQMNLPIGKITASPTGKWQGFFYNGTEWIADRPEALKTAHQNPVSYSDLWGMGHYAMARLLTREQAEEFYQIHPDAQETLLYLELRHTPNLTYPKPMLYRDPRGRAHPVVSSFVTVVPLNRAHLDVIQHAMITSRFYVEAGRAFRYTEGESHLEKGTFDPQLVDIPDGLYEFYYGVGYQIHFGGIRTLLPTHHPLYNRSPELIRNLFNLGMGFNTLFEPVHADQFYTPHRFAYYREGDLYLMGAPILRKEDPTLIQFLKEELEKQHNSSREAPYIAFVDRPPPLHEGKMDRAYLEAFGLKIPEGHILALGDNYALSADSRDFGFVPVTNLLGSASFTFWPPGERLGTFPQPPYPWFTPANLVIGVALLLLLILCVRYTYKKNRSLYFK